MGGGGSVGSSRKTSSESLHKMHLTGGCYIFDKQFSRKAFKSSRDYSYDLVSTLVKNSQYRITSYYFTQQATLFNYVC